MRRCLFASLVVVLCGILAVPAAAQQTTGNITGRVTDQQGGALPGVTVTATQANTGFSRTVVTDGEGVYRLTGLPIGNIDLTMELTGFATLQRKDLVLNVSQTLNLDIQLGVASMSETVTVSGDTPLLETTSSSVGGVVDMNKIEQMPLNGRQFANLAMTVAGVAMGYHSDPTKSSQYSPQIAGGNGRNVNYQIDGGDNNDDTVGGLLQLFPLEAIQEFNFITQRYKAEYGRSNGGVMNIVTKSGTNNFKGSFFTAFRDTSMNALTKTQELANVDKPDYRRYQYGGSFGGPIVQNRAHFFAAFERTQQDTTATVDTLGLYPDKDGTYRHADSREPLHGEGLGEPQRDAVHDGPLRPEHELAGLRRQHAGRPRELGRQHEHVQLDQREPQLGARRVEAERVHLPVRGLRKLHPGAHRGPPPGLRQRRPIGYNVNTPQTTSSTSGSSATTSRGA